jgi:4-oxalomesaconate tautomerase
MTIFGLDGVRCMMMRGGTSKGLYFLGSDLPEDEAARDDFLLRVMGSPDDCQIDGLGGAHPLTSKVAVISPSNEPGVDVDYLFLQVQVDKPIVSSNQTCGNLLAGVGPFAIERGLVGATDGETIVRIRTLNPGGGLTIATIQTPAGRVDYSGDAVISGVPFTAAAIPLESPTPSVPLLPTGNVRDMFAGIEVTCVNAGMPVVLLRADALGITGAESPAELESKAELTRTVEAVRLLAGQAMGFGDVTDDTVPKMSIVSAPTHGGNLSTRTFIPHRVHTSIGVVGAISVAAGALLPGSVASDLLDAPVGTARLRIEHPTGFFDVDVDVYEDSDLVAVRRSAVVRTARKLFDGLVWPRTTETRKVGTDD